MSHSDLSVSLGLSVDCVSLRPVCLSVCLSGAVCGLCLIRTCLSVWGCLWPVSHSDLSVCLSGAVCGLCLTLTCLSVCLSVAVCGLCLTLTCLSVCLSVCLGLSVDCVSLGPVCLSGAVCGLCLTLTCLSVWGCMWTVSHSDLSVCLSGAVCGLWAT